MFLVSLLFVAAIARTLALVSAANQDSGSLTRISSSTAAGITHLETSSSRTISNGIGKAILRGLNNADVSTLSSASVHQTISSTTVPATVRITIPPTISSLSYTGLQRTAALETLTFAFSNTTSIASGVIPEDCQAAHVWYDDQTISILQKTPSTTTKTYTVTNTEVVTLGEANSIYTVDGITYARGSLLDATTSTWRTTSSWITKLSTMDGPASLTLAPLPQSPTCLIRERDCRSMHMSYLDTLYSEDAATHGTATAGYILSDPLPPPSASPRCYWNGCTAQTYSFYTDCTIEGSSVKLYYWPSETSAPASTITAAPRIAITDGITMTSPSIYLSFDTLYANDPQSRAAPRCGAEGSGWSPMRKPVGKEYSNQLISIAPEALSTLEVAWNASVKDVPATAFPDEAVSAMLNPSGTKYSYWRSKIFYAGAQYMTSRINLAHLHQPDPRAYFLRPVYYTGNEGNSTSEFAVGCYSYAPASQCNTIFADYYRAQIAVPNVIRDMDPAWASCVPVLSGIRDPPIALTAVSAMITSTPQTTSPAQTLTLSLAKPVATLDSPIAQYTTGTLQAASSTSTARSNKYTEAVEQHTRAETSISSSNSSDPEQSRSKTNPSSVDPAAHLASIGTLPGSSAATTSSIDDPAAETSHYVAIGLETASAHASSSDSAAPATQAKSEKSDQDPVDGRSTQIRSTIALQPATSPTLAGLNTITIGGETFGKTSTIVRALSAATQTTGGTVVGFAAVPSSVDIESSFTLSTSPALETGKPLVQPTEEHDNIRTSTFLGDVSSRLLLPTLSDPKDPPVVVSTLARSSVPIQDQSNKLSSVHDGPGSMTTATLPTILTHIPTDTIVQYSDGTNTMKPLPTNTPPAAVGTGAARANRPTLKWTSLAVLCMIALTRR